MASRVSAYLDHAATTTLRPEAAEALARLLPATGNPSSLHAAGRAARRAVEEAREQLAEVTSARPGEVVFTGSGTEADNLAVKGIFWARRAEESRRTRVLVSAVEHAAVLASAAWLGVHEGAEVERIPVARNGQVDVDVLTEMVEADPDSIALISVMAANNEVGTVQPLDEVAAVADPHGIPVHTDAVQALGPLGLDFSSSGLAAASLSAHKLGGPIGIGALVLGRTVDAVPVLHGGGQERDLRSGTVAAPLCAAFGAAAMAARDARPVEVPLLRGLRAELISRVTALVPDAVVNGDAHEVLPGTANITFPGCRSDDLLLLLDESGVACSGGSACHSGVLEPSEVLLAMGVGPTAATQSLRFSLGHDSTSADIDALVAALPVAVERARAAALLATGV